MLCYHCGHEPEIAPRAQSASCGRCFGQLKTADISVRAMHWGGSLRTTGSVLVQRKARVVCGEIVAGEGVKILGLVEADIRAGGAVHIGSGAELKGSVRARVLIVEPGAVLTGGMVRVPSAFVAAERVVGALAG